MTQGDLKEFDIPEADLIIAADAGYIYAKQSGLKIDCLIGDFDTLEALPEDDGSLEIDRFIPEKDDTDTMLAVKKAISENCDRIIIFGALGGRYDHTFANIQALNFIAEHGKTGEIISQNDYMTILAPGSYSFKKSENRSFSAFSFSHSCEGITAKGFKYPMDDFTLSYDLPMGVCNEIIEETGEISFKSGRLLIVISKIANHF